MRYETVSVSYDIVSLAQNFEERCHGFSSFVFRRVS